MEKEEHKTEEIFLSCDCGHAIVRVVWDEEYKHYEMCWYEMGHNVDRIKSPSTRWHLLKHRVRLAWKILTKGTLYADDAILSPQSAKELAAFVAKHASDEKCNPDNI